jgi:hypothetical protein
MIKCDILMGTTGLYYGIQENEMTQVASAKPDSSCGLVPAAHNGDEMSTTNPRSPHAHEHARYGIKFAQVMCGTNAEAVQDA